jgi:hypothetical protein
MARTRVRALFDGAVVATEASIANTLSSHTFAGERAGAGARDYGAVLAVEAGIAQASAIACALSLARAGVRAVFVGTGNTMEPTHANALALALVST